MENKNNINEVERSFEEMKNKAKELYPDIETTLEIFNSAKLGTEEYLNYLNLLNTHPLPTASNFTSLK